MTHEEKQMHNAVHAELKDRYPRRQKHLQYRCSAIGIGKMLYECSLPIT